MKAKKIIASALAVTLLSSAFTACSKKSGKGDSISADDPWYSVTKVEIGTDIDTEEYDYIYNSYVGMYNGDFIYRRSGQRKLPRDFDYATDDITPYEVNFIDAYDINGNRTMSVDLSEVINSIQRNDGDSVYFSDLTRRGDQYIVKAQIYSMSGAGSVYSATVDLATGNVTEFTEVAPEEYADRLTSQGGSDEGMIQIGNYTIRKFWFSGDVSSYVIEVIDENGNATEIDFREALPNVDIFNIDSAVSLDENTALIICSSSGASGTVCILLDLSSMTVSQPSGDLSWLANDMSRIVEVEGLGAAVMRPDGLYSLNYANSSIDPVVLYANSNVNLYDVSNLTPILVDGETAILSGNLSDLSKPDSSVTTLFVFEKQDTNPNAGKTIIDVAPVTSYSYPLCEAIKEFNESNGEYFIKLNTTYCLDDYVQAQLNTSDGDADRDVLADSAANTLGNQLAMDIMSGTGPDIIVNGTKYGMLNNDNYLFDMSSFVNENCNDSGYFMNIFDAATDDGHLFQIPLSFNVQGIVTDASNVADGQLGFTYDEYAAFVSGPCNGTDPIGYGKMNFFLKSLSCMQDLVIYDGAPHYDCDAFRALAEYTVANVNEQLQSDDDEEYVMPGDQAATLTSITSVASYFNSVGGTGKVFLGIPTYDGRGPIICSSDSVAISAQTDCPDACREFVSILLGDDIQEYYGYTNGVPVSRAAFDDVGTGYVAIQNHQTELRLQYFTDAELRMYGVNPNMMDESVVGDFESFVNGLSGWYVENGAVNAIIREEIPAFFEGQKTLDDVISILEDRVSTLLSERG